MLLYRTQVVQSIYQTLSVLLEDFQIFLKNLQVPFLPLRLLLCLLQELVSPHPCSLRELQSSVFHLPPLWVLRPIKPFHPQTPLPAPSPSVPQTQSHECECLKSLSMQLVTRGSFHPLFHLETQLERPQQHNFDNKLSCIAHRPKSCFWLRLHMPHNSPDRHGLSQCEWPLGSGVLKCGCVTSFEQLELTRS